MRGSGTEHETWLGFSPKQLWNKSAPPVTSSMSSAATCRSNVPGQTSSPFVPFTKKRPPASTSILTGRFFIDSAAIKAATSSRSSKNTRAWTFRRRSNAWPIGRRSPSNSRPRRANRPRGTSRTACSKFTSRSRSGGNRPWPARLPGKLPGIISPNAQFRPTQ